MVNTCLPCDVVYEDVEKMLCQMCWKYAKLWKMDFNELKSTANKSFMNAYRSWDGSKSSFVTHLYTCVTYGLLDFRIEEAKHADRFKTGLVETSDHEKGMDLTSVPGRKPRPITTLLEHLSEDARTIVQLIIELPEDLDCLARLRSPGKARKKLWEYLQIRGWTLARTSNAFSEIRESLT